MKYLIITILIISALIIAKGLSAARFDWSLGEPVVTEDSDNTTHGTRFDWSLGEPTIVREAETAAPAVATGANKQDIIWFTSD